MTEQEESTKYLDDKDLGKGPSGPPPLRFDINDPEFIKGVPDVIPGLPTRHDLITQTDEGKRLHEIVLKTVRTSKPVLFHPNDIKESISYDKGRAKYVLTIYGITQDGSKAQVVLKDVPVYFDIWYPETEDDSTFSYKMSAALQEFDIVRHETHEAFPLRGYRPKPRKCLRVFFDNLKQRKNAINMVRKMGAGYETASDDRSNYFRMVARTYSIPLCGWLIISKYGYKRGGASCNCEVKTVIDGNEVVLKHTDVQFDNKAPLSAHVFTCSYKNVKALIDTMNPDEATEKKVSKIESIVRDRTLVTTFDIETHSPNKRTGKPPHQDNRDDVVFMLSMTAHWQYDDKPLATVCLVTQNTAPDKRWFTVVCGPGGSPSDINIDGRRSNVEYGQDSLLMAYAILWRMWAPDIHTGFNDGMYDWPFVVGKAYNLGLLSSMVEKMSAEAPRGHQDPDQIMKYMWKDHAQVKISADKKHFMSYLKLPGCVPIDTRVSYMKLYPKAEKTSLNWFLNKVKLGGKADMPYTRMWKIYENAVEIATRQKENAPGSEDYPSEKEIADAAEQMRHVAHYCNVDAARCQALLAKRNVIGEAREIGNYSYTCMNDCIFYAGGHKVCNMLLAYCQRSGVTVEIDGEIKTYPIIGSMIAKEVEIEGKYPGAYVVPPEKGLEEDKPTTGLDYSSLYPSLIRTYNLSLDRAVYSEQQAQELERQGEQIHRVNFKFGGKDIKGWFVRHQEKDEKRGIFARVLADLFDKRAGMKVGLKAYEAEIEYAEQALGEWSTLTPEQKFNTNFADFLRDRADKTQLKGGKKNKARAAEIYAFLKDLPESALKSSKECHHLFELHLDDVEFQFKKIDSKQKAVKVFMNTFYGEAGNKLSPLFMLELAGGVTSAGQYNLQMVAKFVEAKGFGIKYGDTDSLYLTCPPSCYFKDELEYWKAVRDACVKHSVPTPAEVEDAVSRLENNLETRRSKDPLWLAKLFENLKSEGNGAFETEVRLAYKKFAVRKVEITMEQMSILRDEVNAHLTLDNGGKVLKMAYEEVLYPVLFTGKKKYAGIAHVYGPNFDIPGPEKMFIRGIDIVKQGQTKLAKAIGNECLWQAAQLNPPGTRIPYIERVEKVIDDCCKGMSSFRAGEGACTGTGTIQWSLDDFIQTDAWKPDAKNQSVHRFMNRMRPRHKLQLAENETLAQMGEPLVELDYVEPEPGSRFSYLIVDSGPRINIRGMSEGSPKKGDLMEYVEVAKKHNMLINVVYYLEHYVVGLCARFINYAPIFELKSSGDRPVDAKEADTYAQKEAVKYLKNMIKNMQKDSSSDASNLRKKYKHAYAYAVDKVSSALLESVEVDDEISAALGMMTGYEGDSIAKYNKAVIEMSPQERAANRILDFSTFLEAGGEEEYAPPIADTIRIYAERCAKDMIDFAENVPYLSWDVENNCPLPNIKSNIQTLVMHTLKQMGVLVKNDSGRLSVDKQTLFRQLSRMRGSRDVRRKSGGKRLSTEIVHEQLSKVENEAYASIMEASPRLSALSSRIQVGIEELVMVERTRVDDEDDALKDFACDKAEEEALKGLGCTDLEADALRKTQAACLDMVGVYYTRMMHVALVKALERVRDACM